MSGREAAETKAAMALVDGGCSVRSAARQSGIERSTLIRALARRVAKLAQANEQTAAIKAEEI
jgi:lambda repressor-like predicted transcriptional regulator